MVNETFTITPRPKGGGVNLTGPILPWPLWFAREEDAVSYARRRCDGGGIVETMDVTGNLLRREPLAPSQTWLYEHRGG